VVARGPPWDLLADCMAGEAGRFSMVMMTGSMAFNIILAVASSAGTGRPSSMTSIRSPL